MSFPEMDGLNRMAASTTYVAVAPTVTRGDIPALCAEVAGRLRGRGGGVVVCDVAQVVRPDVVTVEALARLHLTARRHGCTLLVHGAAPGLLELVSLLGLDDVLPQAGGQPEEREQARGGEEVVDGRDPPG
jgi:ABC-type transporter Mla MlaB component